MTESFWARGQRCSKQSYDSTYDVDGGDLELALLEELVEVVNTGGGLLGDTLDVLEELRKLCRERK